ncbi:hypothetical protein BX600DRAFT_78411 [Xylariales sp. PMI_506]|nr:hypothetical protein BX600DRAFT_78411 [Xylariales sp. PMI_506]
MYHASYAVPSAGYAVLTQCSGRPYTPLTQTRLMARHVTFIAALTSDYLELAVPAWLTSQFRGLLSAKPVEQGENHGPRFCQYDAEQDAWWLPYYPKLKSTPHPHKFLNKLAAYTLCILYVHGIHQDGWVRSGTGAFPTLLHDQDICQTVGFLPSTTPASEPVTSTNCLATLG